MNRLHFVFAFVIALVTPHVALAQAKVSRDVSNETVEKVLQGIGLKFTKAPPKDKDAALLYFEFTRSDLPVRLKNYGKDLWIETTVDKKLRLDDVNRWNADAKFSRLVLIENKDSTTLSLEAQLDCTGGVTEAAIRQFVNRFDEETKKFAKFVK